MKKGGQVWIETVIYTLIAFILIGMVLAFAKPKIEEMQDKAFIEQSIEVLKEIDDIVRDIKSGGEGNKRQIELGIKKGVLTIDGENDLFMFEIESRYEYSEPEKEISDAGIIILTEKTGDIYQVTLTKLYEENDIKFQEEDILKSISKSPTSYTIFISNLGGEKTIINVEVA